MGNFWIEKKHTSYFLEIDGVFISNADASHEPRLDMSGNNFTGCVRWKPISIKCTARKNKPLLQWVYQVVFRTQLEDNAHKGTATLKIFDYTDDLIQSWKLCDAWVQTIGVDYNNLEIEFTIHYSSATLL